MTLPVPHNSCVISGRTAQRLLDASTGEVSVSLDLGLSRSAVRVEKDVVTLPDGQLISRDNLSAAFSAPEDCIEIAQGACEKIYVFDHQAGKYYKLFQPFEDRAPTLVINNATMHAIVRMDPWQDEQEKVSALSPRGGECLDTCFGLGYSAQLLVRAGCEHVVSCEADPNVLGCAAANPWSGGAFGDPRIEILQADVREYLRRRQEGSFAAIFHDPPTIHQAGELYAAELYAEFARVLASGGVLYHYVGAPGARLGRDLTRGVMRRLHDAGFARIQRRARGVIARRKRGRLLIIA